MSRSVSYANGSVVVCYSSHNMEEEDDDDFEYLTEDYQESFCSKYPSMNPINKWLDREDLALAENKFCYMGISEYCGLISVWIVPKEEYEYPSLRDSWIKNITKRFTDTFGLLRKIGTFSNGESVYEPIKIESPLNIAN